MRSILILFAFVVGVICASIFPPNCPAQSLDWANSDSDTHFGLSPSQDANIQCEGGTCRLVKLGQGRAEPVANLVPFSQETISPAVVSPTPCVQSSIPAIEHIAQQPSGECYSEQRQPLRTAAKAPVYFAAKVVQRVRDRERKPLRRLAGWVFCR